jgi:hypothetical protein
VDVKKAMTDIRLFDEAHIEEYITERDRRANDGRDPVYLEDISNMKR